MTERNSLPEMGVGCCEEGENKRDQVLISQSGFRLSKLRRLAIGLEVSVPRRD